MKRPIGYLILTSAALAGCSAPQSADLCTDPAVAPGMLAFFQDNYWRYTYAIMRQDGWSQFYDPSLQNALFDDATVTLGAVDTLTSGSAGQEASCVADVRVDFGEEAVGLIDQTLDLVDGENRIVLAQGDGVGFVDTGLWVRMHYVVTPQGDAMQVTADDGELLLYALARYSAITMIGRGMGASTGSPEVAEPDPQADATSAPEPAPTLAAEPEPAPSEAAATPQ